MVKELLLPWIIVVNVWSGTTHGWSKWMSDTRDPNKSICDPNNGNSGKGKLY